MPHPRDTPAKAPNQYNLRLVRTLSEEDGVGGGCMGFGDRTSYVMTPNGWLIVASPEECRLKVFDARGMFVRPIVCRKDDYDAPLHPDIVALGPQDSVIVVDKRSGIIGIFGISGKFIRKFGVKKNGEQGGIEDVHVTSQGNTIVVLNSDRVITVLDSSGACLGEMELGYGVEWFFSNGRMLTSSWRLYDFTKMNAKKFQPVMLEGSDARHDDIRGFAADDEGNAYVREWRIDIKVYNASGNMIKVMKGGPITIYGTYHMAVLANKHIAISGARSTSIWDGEKIHEFTGDLLAVVGGKAVVGEIFGTYGQYHGVGKYWPMLDFQKITMPETVQRLFKIYSLSEMPVAVDTADRIILGDHGCVRILNPDCSVKKIITDADGQGCMFGEITAVTTDKKNRIIVADVHTQVLIPDNYYERRKIERTKHVRVFDANGKFLESNTDDEFRANGHTRIADMLERPRVMACDSHDRVVAVVVNDPSMGHRRLDTRIEIRDTSGNAVKEISVDGGHGERIDFADALTVDKWDRIITVERHLLTIRIFDHAGNPIKTVRGTSIGGKNLKRIHGIASDGTGRIIISGYDENGVALIQIFGPGNKPRTKPGRNRQRTVQHGMEPLRILKVRYAKGEITDEQFEAMKKRLA